MTEILNTETLKLLRAPLVDEIARAEDNAKYARETLAKCEGELANAQELAALSDAELTAFITSDPVRMMLNTLIEGMGGITNIQHILSPTSIEIGRDYTSISLGWGERVNARTLDGRLHMTNRLWVSIGNGQISVGCHHQERFNNVDEAIRYIEGMFDVSFSGGVRRANVVTSTEVVIPYELGPYERRIRDFIGALNLGLAVSVRTKRGPKTRNTKRAPNPTE